jgi:hypothetical protein
MTCPVCSVEVPGHVFLSALGLRDMACPNCGIELETTYESRLRLVGGGLALAFVAAGLVRSFGLSGAIPLGASATTFGAWVYLKAGQILSLRRAAPPMPSIR